MADEKPELGVLWQRTSGKGVEFLSGTINGVEVVAFKAKPSAKGPTWRVFKSEPRSTARASETSQRQPPSDLDGF